MSQEGLSVVEVDLEGALRVGPPRLLFEAERESLREGPYPDYDITPDGQRFFVLSGGSYREDEIQVVVNWHQELKRLVPTE